MPACSVTSCPTFWPTFLLVRMLTDLSQTKPPRSDSMARLLFLSRSTPSTTVPHPSALASPAAAPTDSDMLLDSAPPRSRVLPPVPDSAPPTAAVRETGMAPRALLLPAVDPATAPSPPSDDAPQAQLASAHAAASSAVTVFPRKDFPTFASVNTIWRLP